MKTPKARGRLFFGTANVASGLLLAWGVFSALPSRWWPVDVPAALSTALLLASGAALLGRHRYAGTLARLACLVVLALGLVLVAVLVATASWLGTVYGPVGRGGAAIFGIVLALALPYLVILPAAELVWLGPRAPRGSSAP